MAINLTGYYSYLNSLTAGNNSLSSGIMQAVNRTGNYSAEYRAVGQPDDSANDNGFEMAFMAMLNQSKEAFAKIEEVNRAESETGGASLNDSLSGLLNIYNSMNRTSSAPGSIKEALLSMMNGTDTPSQDQTLGSYQSGFNYNPDLNVEEIISKAMKNV